MANTQKPPQEGLIAEWVPVRGHNGDTIYAYSARPMGEGPYPGVLVVMEIFGLVEHIKEQTRRIAAHGYVAVAPDLYYREGPGAPEDVGAKVRAAGGISDEQFIGDAQATINHIRALPQSNGKVGSIGWCSGGRHSFVAACNTDIDAAVICYSGRVVATPDQLTPKQPKSPHEMTPNLKAPVLGLFGEEDQNPTPAQVAQLEEMLKKNKKQYEFHMYKNAGHGFFADYRPSYRVEAVNDAWQKVWAFYQKHLR